MDVINLSEKIIGGHRIKRGDDTEFFLTAELDELCRGADMIRKHFKGDRVDLCSIINGRSGKCSENCKF